MADLTEPGEFAGLFDRHYAGLHRYLHRRVGQALADDLASETFAEAIRHRHRYDPGKGDPGPWLYGIAHVLLRRHRRTEQRQLRAYARTGVDPVHVDGADETVARVDAAARGADIARALAAMRPGDRDVLLLFALGDLGYADIAQALSMPIGTVRSKLHRARRRLQAELGDPGPPGAPATVPFAPSVLDPEATR